MPSRLLLLVAAVATGIGHAAPAAAILDGDSLALDEAATGLTLRTFSLQPPPPPDPLDPPITLKPAARPWTVQLEPMFWWASPGGRLRLPGTGTGGQSVRMERLNLDSPSMSVFGEAHVDARPWRFSFSGGENSLKRRNTTADATFILGDVPVRAGDPLRVEFEYTLVEWTVGYLILERDYAAKSQRPQDALPMLLSVYALGGLRVHDLNISVQNLALSEAVAASNQFYLEPILGTRVEMSIDRDYTIDLQISGGYFNLSDRSIASLDIAVGFMWHPTPNFGWQLGWRQILTWMDDGQGPGLFQYHGGTAGLYTGLVLRF